MTEPQKIYVGNDMWAIVDDDWFPHLIKYQWRAELFHSSYYAVTDVAGRNGKRKLRMHRLVANTPPRKFPHHRNHNTLDNRRENLLNVTSQEHDELHSRSHIRIKYALPNASGPRDES